MFFYKFISYVASYVGRWPSCQVSGGTGIVIPVQNEQQERKIQESGGFLQE